MLKKFKSPLSDSPLSPLVWRVVILIYCAFIALCLVIIAYHSASKYFAANIFLVLSMLAGLTVLKYLWSGVASNYAGRLSYKKSPLNFWFGVLVVLIFGVFLLFGIGSGWFIPFH